MNNTQKRILVLSLLCVCALIVCFLRIDYLYHTPKIVLNGNETITINLYEKYNEMGAVAYNHDTDLTEYIKISNNIDEKTPGEYKVIYSLNNSKKERNVIVRDNIPPIIKLNGNEKIIVKINTEYKDKGARAIDNIDGNISNKLEIYSNVDTSKIGDYTITYKIKDKSGNITTQERKVLVRENDTYVRISIEKQIIEVFKNSELIISSPIVTGTKKYNYTQRDTYKI